MRILIPQEYLCPISRQIMREPVLARDGYTYEKEIFMTWISSNNMSPEARVDANNQLVGENIVLRKNIESFLNLYRDRSDFDVHVYLPDSWKLKLREAIKGLDLTAFKNYLNKDPRLAYTQSSDGYMIFHLIFEFGTMAMLDYFHKKIGNDDFSRIRSAISPQNWNPKLLGQLNKELREAFVNNQQDRVSELLRMGAESNINELFLSAVRDQSHAQACFFLSCYADVNYKDKEGKSALHIASSEGDAHLCDILLENNANIESCTVDGMTALLLAIKNKKQFTVRFLLEKGACPYKTGSMKVSAYELAREINDIDIINILKEFESQRIFILQCTLTSLVQTTDAIAGAFRELDSLYSLFLNAIRCLIQTVETQKARVSTLETQVSSLQRGEKRPAENELVAPGFAKRRALAPPPTGLEADERGSQLSI